MVTPDKTFTTLAAESFNRELIVNAENAVLSSRLIRGEDEEVSEGEGEPRADIVEAGPAAPQTPVGKPQRGRSAFEWYKKDKVGSETKNQILPRVR